MTQTPDPSAPDKHMYATNQTRFVNFDKTLLFFMIHSIVIVVVLMRLILHVSGIVVVDDCVKVAFFYGMHVASSVYPTPSSTDSLSASSVFNDLNLCKSVTGSDPVGTAGSQIQSSSFLGWHSAENIVNSDASDRTEDSIRIKHFLGGKCLKDVTRTGPRSQTLSVRIFTRIGVDFGKGDIGLSRG